MAKHSHFIHKTIYEYKDYKEYLRAVLGVTGSQRGLRSRLAATLQCQTSFVSRVIQGPAEFSSEHAMRVSVFLGHTDDERDYFLLLINHARSGTQELRQYYSIKIQKMFEAHKEIRDKVRVGKSISNEAQSRYYNSWHYSAIHILACIPAFQDGSHISEYLGLPIDLVNEAIAFLLQEGLLIEVGRKIQAGPTRIHLNNQSPMIVRHHTNWRLQSIRAVEKKNKKNFHYSGVISVSLKNASKVESILLETLEKIEPLLAEKNEEAAFGLVVDFFNLSCQKR